MTTRRERKLKQNNADEACVCASSDEFIIVLTSEICVRASTTLTTHWRCQINLHSSLVKVNEFGSHAGRVQQAATKRNANFYFFDDSKLIRLLWSKLNIESRRRQAERSIHGIFHMSYSCCRRKIASRAVWVECRIENFNFEMRSHFFLLYEKNLIFVPLQPIFFLLSDARMYTFSCQSDRSR